MIYATFNKPCVGYFYLPHRSRLNRFQIITLHCATHSDVYNGLQLLSFSKNMTA